MDAAVVARSIGAQCLCFKTRKLARLLTRAYDEALRPVGLQSTQLSLMCVVAAAGEAGQRMPRLAEVLATDPTTLSRNLKPLEAAGLIRVDRLEGDRRVRLARLTDAGRERMAAALPLWERAQAQVRAGLGEASADALRAALDTNTARLAGR